jgi:Zn-dependent alcohol dehydrogenase
VVFGAGGVGLNAIQGCRIAGAAMIIAVDTLESKLALAREFGATHVINAKTEPDVVKTIKKMTAGGPDYGFECIGNSETVSQTYRAIRKGGKAVVIGVARPNDSCSIRTMSLPFEEKILTGSMYGSTRPQEDFPRLLALYKGGQLKLDELITATYSIDQAAQAFSDMVEGKNARGVILFGGRPLL